ncbi:hypothetical protein GV819_06440 [Pseudomonas sp. Fl5BN2]|uniref:hypothetical protein n=1 Tax=Pseudomonas sp. Fl5BN2 TaxID=2697652 RepID=UPI001376DB1C|nr:hypothetical protein [Pseudomonas sp. Fl5BN2]NBF01925.1 hypothetical protein [Pseudomonas sp. Fl5BN2]
MIEPTVALDKSVSEGHSVINRKTRKPSSMYFPNISPTKLLVKQAIQGLEEISVQKRASKSPERHHPLTGKTTEINRKYVNSIVNAYGFTAPVSGELTTTL